MSLACANETQTQLLELYSDPDAPKRHLKIGGIIVCVYFNKICQHFPLHTKEGAF